MLLEWKVIDSRWNEYVSTLFNLQNSHCAQAPIDTERATICGDGF
jgi:hypothetical protein